GQIQGIPSPVAVRAAWPPRGSGGHFLWGHTTMRSRIRAAPPPQQPCSASLYLAGALPRLGFEEMALEVQEAGGDLVQRGSVLEPQQTLSTEREAVGREERSPRRCVRLLESCLGHQVPCCDPCATCYCRFFNAFCYCRKISTTFPCGKN
ncbi:AGRP protein, partial [Podargus strigoides]|nr:AGRP protein [Podargus strigoides]